MQVGTNYWQNTTSYESRSKSGAVPQFTQYIPEESTESIQNLSATTQIDCNELAFENAGPNAPQSVKDAWMEASKEAGANGLGITSNGQYHTEMLTQQIIAWYNGGKEGRAYDVLGGSVESALQATKQALYDFDHPLEPKKVMSIEEQQARMKERQFYVIFLEKLENLLNE